MYKDSFDLVFNAEDDSYCSDYAASETDEELCMYVKCLAETLGHMLQDIKRNHPNKYPERRIKTFCRVVCKIL